MGHKVGTSEKHIWTIKDSGTNLYLRTYNSMKYNHASQRQELTIYAINWSPAAYNIARSEVGTRLILEKCINYWKLKREELNNKLDYAVKELDRILLRNSDTRSIDNHIDDIKDDIQSINRYLTAQFEICKLIVTKNVTEVCIPA